jgi:hypothetical protein
MDRRTTLKSLLLGTVAGGLAIQGCKPGSEKTLDASVIKDSGGYGRTPKEMERDQSLHQEKLFSDHELATIAILCDIILPADALSGSATEAEVPAFIEFIAKDIPNHQIPLRGGMMWLDHTCNTRFGRVFKDLSQDQQIDIVDLIAYPDTFADVHKPGVRFFSLMRDLTISGYYTTRMGIDALGYKGNVPNVWDGVPGEVLKKHGVEYEEGWLAKCIDQNTRSEIAKWDENGNLI